ncbi:hypothetical protein LCGC14_2089280 [marine sediment metagenome]|uniref:DUF86 domain-containing protein n=1 Tax=marine sediment metagenome TaxID=412755 RepID=A0A0F9GRE3_9ZZZZ
MIDAAKEALSFASGKSRTDLESNRMLVLALVKDIEIIGEAASRISEEFKASYPQIPWQEIIGMRNRLIHVYFDVDLDVLWSTVTKNLPQLVVELDNL